MGYSGDCGWLENLDVHSCVLLFELDSDHIDDPVRCVV